MTDQSSQPPDRALAEATAFIRGHHAGWDSCFAHFYAKQMPAVPEGFKLVSVKGFDELCEALERAARKGYMPDAIADEWAAFDYRLAAAPHPLTP